MDFTFEDLKKKTVAQLREIAAGIEHEAVQGYTQLNKEHLILAVCKALGVDTFTHHHAEVLNKAGIKKQIRLLKQKRDEAIATHNSVEIKSIRRQIHQMKRRLRKAMV
jgi:hypothetical protein